MPSEFIPQKGDYRRLRVFQIAEVIYDVTFMFTHRFLSKGDRTIDQMVQAARSGKQNIAEGSCAGSTSKETEIKLTNVAKASLQELLLDYEDFLRVRDLELWDKNSTKAVKARAICESHNDSAFYRAGLKGYPAEAIANIAIVLLHQADVLLQGLINRQKDDFLSQGGIREQMSAARRAYRTSRPPQGPSATPNAQPPQNPPSSQTPSSTPNVQRPQTPPSSPSAQSSLNPESPRSPRDSNNKKA